MPKLKEDYWNYRFFEIDTLYEPYYELREVFYDSNDNIVGWTKEAESIFCETKKDMLITLKQIKQACNKTVLKEENGKIKDTKKKIRKKYF